MGLTSGLWKLLGASQERDTKKAKGAIDASTEFDAWAAGLDTSEFADAAHAVDLHGEPAPDAAKFLALAREAGAPPSAMAARAHRSASVKSSAAR